jgi:hypothetical protein
MKATHSYLTFENMYSALDSSLGQDALGIGSTITISAAHTITQILSKKHSLGNLWNTNVSTCV